MTATANEDDEGPHVCSDRLSLISSAFLVGLEYETSPVSQHDLRGREYVNICRIKINSDDSNEKIDKEIEEFIDHFFAKFDEMSIRREFRDEMSEIYQALSGDASGDDIYLSDGVWLSSDG